ncbi:unnamed protein product [Adineta ricciae]|uniref:REJ domain-containing protein n=1 Tax=Adineta ricciae TaxID=249248 RepID=A0A815UQH2_ADIRI|nr:unnamed protein product [Adineta ricciae]
MIDDLFLVHSRLWKFEVAYTLRLGCGLSVLYFLLNQCLFNDSFSVTPNNGTITNLCTLSCSDYFHENEIKDYSFYIWTTKSSASVMVAFSAASTFQVRLPVGNNSDSLMNLVVHIRDQLDCVTRFSLRSIKLHALSLAELIYAINQLTQLSSIITSTKCYELAKALHSISPKLSYEDIQLAVTLITQCASNVLNRFTTAASNVAARFGSVAFI